MEKIKSWWSEDGKWFCILVNDGVNQATVSLTPTEAEALAIGIDNHVRSPAADKEPDIVKTLRFWEGRDDVPEDLQSYLSVAADEIAGLRDETAYYKKIIDDASPRF